MSQNSMRRASDAFVRPIDTMTKTITLSIMIVGAIIFLGKKSMAVEQNTAAIVAIQVENSVQDTAIGEIKETLRVLTYLGCSQARRNDPTLSLPAECSKVISMSR